MFSSNFSKKGIIKQLTVGRRRPSGPPLPIVRLLYLECKTQCDITVFSLTILLRNPYYRTYFLRTFRKNVEIRVLVRLN